MPKRSAAQTQPFQLKRLKPVHRQAIQLHLQGLKLREIAKETGMSLWHISRVLSTDMAQGVIARHHELVEMEFKSQYLHTIESLREGLRDGDLGVRLQAADKVLRAHSQEFERARERGKAVEDVIQQIMEYPS